MAIRRAGPNLQQDTLQQVHTQRRNANDVLPIKRHCALSLRRGVRLTLLAAALTLAGRAQVAHAETFNVSCNAAALASVITTVNTNGEEDFVWLASTCVYPLAATWVVQVDGGNPVRVHGRGTTLSGQDARTVVVVDPGATLHLSKVRVRDGATTARGEHVAHVAQRGGDAVAASRRGGELALGVAADPLGVLLR